MQRVATKVLFVTGASRGLGGLIVEKALRAGHSVVATARTPRLLIELLGDRPSALPLALDVTDEAQAHAAAMAAIARFGRIDVLVNQAGCALRGAVEETSAKEIEALYRTNVFGLLAVTRAVLPSMRRQRAGHVINFSSGAEGVPGLGVYCSTQLAVEGLSEALAAELRPLGIHVTILRSGFPRAAPFDARPSPVSARAIADYRNTSGALFMRVDEPSRNHPSHPTQLADAVLELIDNPNPPLRLMLPDRR